ncbi:MAG: hypothetical protein PHO01_11140 [Desulfotomaculaceae bacterium]|nr:hypothetical protein [Desulfotomaculaceae bacterium]
MNIPYSISLEVNSGCNIGNSPTIRQSPHDLCSPGDQLNNLRDAQQVFKLKSTDNVCIHLGLNAPSGYRS